MHTRINFMTCYDSQNIPYSADWAPDINPMSSAQSCAQSLNMNWTAIQACGGNISGKFANGTWNETVGSQAWELAKEAATYFYNTFPTYRGIDTPMFHVPHLYINNVEQPLNNLVSMWNLTKQLCNNGAQRAAVCDSVDQADLPDWDGAVRPSGEIVA